MTPRKPQGFNQTQLEYLQANYQPLQDQKRLPYLVYAIRMFAINIIIWLLLGLGFSFLPEIFAGKTWKWEVKMLWALACLLMLLLAWGRCW